MRVGELIRKKREHLGLTQAELGTKVGMSGQFISNIERFESLPPKKSIHKMMTVLKINRNEMMSIMRKEYADKLTGMI